MERVWLSSFYPDFICVTTSFVMLYLAHILFSIVLFWNSWPRCGFWPHPCRVDDPLRLYASEDSSGTSLFLSMPPGPGFMCWLFGSSVCFFLVTQTRF